MEPSEEYLATTLVLIRHAQARGSDGLYGREASLSDLGRQQAEVLANYLVAGDPIVEVYSSSLPRAVETATLVCQRFCLEPVVDTRLVEFELGTNSIASIPERPDLLIWRPEHRAADGETLQEFSARVAAFCDEIVERHLGARIAVFSHAGTIDAILRWSLSLAPECPWQHEFDVANASITELEFWPHGRIQGGAPRYAVLRGIGEVGHLGGLVTEI